MILKLRIQVVLLMAKFESSLEVIRALRKEGCENIPSRQAISNLYDKFCEFGTVLDKERSGRPKISEEESTTPITEFLEIKPKSTLIELSGLTGLSRSTISRRIKYDIGMFPYRIHTHQELHDDDYDRRVEMADSLLPILQNPKYENFIFFSDEATFT
jgi:AraC-like DNA-binding protein